VTVTAQRSLQRRAIVAAQLATNGSSAHPAARLQKAVAVGQHDLSSFFKVSRLAQPQQLKMEALVSLAMAKLACRPPVEADDIDFRKAIGLRRQWKPARQIPAFVDIGSNDRSDGFAFVIRHSSSDREQHKATEIHGAKLRILDKMAGVIDDAK